MTLFPNTYAFVRYKARPDELFFCAAHPDRFVRVAIAGNLLTPNAAILECLYDSDSVVCGSALQNLFRRMKTPQAAAGPLLIIEAKYSEKILASLTTRALMGKKEDWYLRSVIAEIHEDADVLAKLFEMHELPVLLVLAHKRACPRDILGKLAALPVKPMSKGILGNRLDDENKEVREVARGRPGGIARALSDRYEE